MDVDITVAVCLCDLLIIYFAQPVVCRDGTGVGENQTTDGICNGGILFHTPVQLTQIAVNGICIIQIGGFCITQFFAVFTIEDVGLGHCFVTGAGQNRFHTVLNVFHCDLIVLDLILKICRYLQGDEIYNIRRILTLRSIECLLDGRRDLAQIEIYNFSVSFNYLIHFLLPPKQLNSSKLYGGDKLPRTVAQCIHFFCGKRCQTLGSQYISGIHILLQIILPGPLDPLGCFADALFRMDSFHDRRAEFILDPALHQEFLGLGDGAQIQVGHPCRFSVPRRIIFNIHGDAVRQFFLHHSAQPFREGSVAVQFDGESQFPDLSQKLQRSIVEERFSSGDGHTIQDALSGLQKAKDLFFCHILRHLLRKHQSCVVAEGAPEVAPAGKDRTCDLPRIVQQC